ncbi:hypothetical protein CFP56_040418 [Quercus suber]|uniref:Uncharacterized protein n=1 Tax=Quercus suber TaxID=58331 RepID=A0AAW0IYN2_QUESU
MKPWSFTVYYLVRFYVNLLYLVCKFCRAINKNFNKFDLSDCLPLSLRIFAKFGEISTPPWWLISTKAVVDDRSSIFPPNMVESSDKWTPNLSVSTRRHP